MLPSIVFIIIFLIFIINIVENFDIFWENFRAILAFAAWVTFCLLLPTYLLSELYREVIVKQLKFDNKVSLFLILILDLLLIICLTTIIFGREAFLEKRKRRKFLNKKKKEEQEKLLYLKRIKGMSIPKDFITKKANVVDNSNYNYQSQTSNFYNDDDDIYDEWGFTKEELESLEKDYQNELTYESYLESLRGSKEKGYKLSETHYLHSYYPKASGKEDFQSDRILNFKNGIKGDVEYYCDESKKKFLSNRQKYDIIIRALGSNEISVTNGSKPLDKLCIEISKVTNAKYRPEVVSKTRTTRPLKVQNLQERKNEIKNVYKLNTHENLNHKKILIVDDIRTSGTTISEITQTIKTKYPNSIIDSFCLAQTM